MVDAETAVDAVKEVTTRLRFQPHHIEAKLCVPDIEDKFHNTELQPGEVRRIRPR